MPPNPFAGTDQPPDRPRECPWSTPTFLALFMAYWSVALAADSLGGGIPAQTAIGALTWLFLALALWVSPAVLRGPALAMVVVATGCEVIGSLLWGAYTYRLHNLPAYVPPGHGLFYLAALRLAALPALRRHARRIVMAVAVASALWCLHGLAAGPRADLLGGLCWFFLAFFLRRGRDPLLLAVTFSLTMLLEFYGTALGCWHWAAVLPGTALSAANPPAAIAAGYCGLDLLARRLVRYAPAWATSLARPRSRGRRVDAAAARRVTHGRRP